MNGPKVENAALEKSDYVLRSPSIQCYCGVARSAHAKQPAKAKAEPYCAPQ